MCLQKKKKPQLTRALTPKNLNCSVRPINEKPCNPHGKNRGVLASFYDKKRNFEKLPFQLERNLNFLP